MKIVIYWEQYMWGGVDTKLLTLLQYWPNPSDQFIMFTNTSNPGIPRIADELKKIKNLQVIPFSICSYAEFNTRFQNTAFKYIVKVVGNLVFPIFFWIMKRQACRLFESVAPFDIMISDNGGYPAGWGSLASLFAAKELGIQHRVLVVNHCAVVPRWHTRWFEEWVDKKLKTTYTRLITISQATLKTVVERRPYLVDNKKAAVVYPGLIINQTPYPKTLFSYPNKKVIGVMGRIERYKGHEDLVYALSELSPEELSQIQVVFVGTGPDVFDRSLKQLIKKYRLQEKIHFAGYIPKSSNEIAANFDLLLVLTRDFEGFGLTLAEAMSAGTPVCATRVGAIPEFVIEGKTGILIDPKAPTQIAQKLRDFLNHPQAWKDRAQTAKIFIQNFSAEKMSTNFRQILLSNQK